MTIYNDNASAFATTADQRIRELRRQGIADAMIFIVDGYPHIAEQIMGETLTAQARIAGIRPLELVPSGAA